VYKPVRSPDQEYETTNNLNNIDKHRVYMKNRGRLREGVHRPTARWADSSGVSYTIGAQHWEAPENPVTLRALSIR
jgi:hypothetical protein